MKIVKTFLMAVAIFAMAFSAHAEVLQSSGSALVKVVNAKGVWQFEPVSYTTATQAVSIVAGVAGISVTATIAGGSAAVSTTISSVAVGVSITVNNTNASAVPVRLTGATNVTVQGYNNIGGVLQTVYTAAHNSGFVATDIGLQAVGSINGVNGAALSATNPIPISDVAKAATSSILSTMNTTTALTVGATPIYLTTSAVSAVYIDNSFGAVTVKYQITNSATVPSNMTTVGQGILPGQSILIGTPSGHLALNDHYLWYINPGSVSLTSKNSF